MRSSIALPFSSAGFFSWLDFPVHGLALVLLIGDVHSVKSRPALPRSGGGIRLEADRERHRKQACEWRDRGRRNASCPASESRPRPPHHDAREKFPAPSL